MQIQGQCIIVLASLHIKDELKLKHYSKTKSLKNKKQSIIYRLQLKQILVPSWINKLQQMQSNKLANKHRVKNHSIKIVWLKVKLKTNSIFKGTNVYRLKNNLNFDMSALVIGFCHNDSLCPLKCKCTVKRSFLCRYCSLFVWNLKQLCITYETKS